MSRIRTIKPEFWSSGQVLECSRNARLLFIGLWNFCDDLGRHSFSPRQIKAEVFPADEDLSTENILAMIEELSQNGLIEVYLVDGQKLLQVTGWHHQRIDKPQKGKFPSPIDESSGNSQGTIPPESKGVERKGKESSRVRAAARARPNSTQKIFQSILEIEKPNAQQIEDAQRYGLNTVEAVEAEFEHFRDYNLAIGKKLSDWDAAWRNWLAKIGEYKPKQQVAKTNGHSRQSPSAPSQVFIEEGTPQWNAWDQSWRESHQGVGPPTLERGTKKGWLFPTDYPPSNG